MGRTSPNGPGLAEVRRELELLVVIRRCAELSPELDVRCIELCER